MDIRWLVVLALLLIAAEYAVYQWRGVRSIKYSRRFSDAVVDAFASVDMVEVIENNGYLPIPRAVLESTFDRSLLFASGVDLNVRNTERYQNHRSYFSIGSKMRIRRTHHITCMRRGVYHLDSASMTCQDILGLSTVHVPWKLQGEGLTLVVRPPVHPIADPSVGFTSWQGELPVSRWILPDPFLRSGTRPYQPGDAHNRINWKATARTLQLQVYQEEYTADPKVMILLNFEIMEDMWNQVVAPERVEAGISMAASLAAHYIGLSQAVGFGCNGELMMGENVEAGVIYPGAGAAHLDGILLSMAHLEIQVNRAFSDLLADLGLEVRDRTDFILVTGYVSERIQVQVDSLRAAGHSVTVLPLPKEEEVESWLGEIRADVGGDIEVNSHVG